MIGVVGGIQRSVQSIRDIGDRIIKDLIRQQKPELDQKIDQMLKPKIINQIMQKYLAIGKAIGKAVGRIGKGISIGKRFKLIGRLL